MILSHKMIKSEDSYLLNFIIPNFERNPKENSKIMVKLIMDKGIDPNQLRVKYLRKKVEPAKKKVAPDHLPASIIDTGSIALAC